MKRLAAYHLPAQFVMKPSLPSQILCYWKMLMSLFVKNVSDYQ